MAMTLHAPVAGFVGGTNRLASTNASPSRSINLFPEHTAPSGKTPAYLRGSEGLSPFAEVADTDTHCEFSINGRNFCCTGTSFAEIYEDGTTQIWGTITYDAPTPATMASNGSAGNQIAIVSRPNLYIFDLQTSAFQVVDVDGLELDMVEFMDGYFFVLVHDSRQVRFSALEDGLTWPGLNVFERSWGSDNISAIKRAGRQLWLIGNQTSEVWSDTGDANTPFQPIQGVFLDKGTISGRTVVRDGETLIWTMADERGSGVVVRADGYRPQDISTYAIDLMTARRQGALSQLSGFCHQNEGHLFYWLQLDTQPDPTEGTTTTPVLDLTEGIWSERAMWQPDQATYIPHVARCHVFATGIEKHLVGVRDSGILYDMSFAWLDNGV